MSARRSQRIRSLRKPCSQAMLRSITNRQVSSPVPCRVPRRAIAGRARRSLTWPRWVTSLWLPPVNRTASGVPCPSVITWYSEPARPRSTGEGPVCCLLQGRTWEESTKQRDKSGRDA